MRPRIMLRRRRPMPKRYPGGNQAHPHTLAAQLEEFGRAFRALVPR